MTQRDEGVRLRVGPAVVGIAVIAELWLLWMLGTYLNVPDGAEIRAMCRHHGGVASVAAPALLLQETAVVCRDGWAAWK